MKKFLFLALFTLMGFVSNAQSLNTKYIQIKDVYAFQETKNEYRVQDFLKNKLTDLGYVVLEENETLPNDLNKETCKVLICNVEREQNSLTTRLVVNFLNCKNEVVYSTKGLSKLKIHKKSYPEALRNAFDNSVLKSK